MANELAIRQYFRWNKKKYNRVVHITDLNGVDVILDFSEKGNNCMVLVGTRLVGEFYPKEKKGA